MNTPSDLKYAKTDEWVRLEGDIAVIGVSDYAQDALSDVVFFEAVVSIGDQVKAGTQIATLESVKAAADVNTSVSGEVIEINESLSSSPELVNSDPYGAAWMLKVKISDPAELEALMSAQQYEDYCASRSH